MSAAIASSEARRDDFAYALADFNPQAGQRDAKVTFAILSVLLVMTFSMVGITFYSPLSLTGRANVNHSDPTVFKVKTIFENSILSHQNGLLIEQRAEEETLFFNRSMGWKNGDTTFSGVLPVEVARFFEEGIIIARDACAGASSFPKRLEATNLVYDWTVTLLDTKLPFEDTRAILRFAQPRIEWIGNNCQLVHDLFPNFTNLKQLVTYPGIPRITYSNLREPLFQNEEASYEKNGHLKVNELTQASQIKPGSYVYVMMANGTTLFSKDLRFHSVQDRENGGRLRLGPNHANLAKGEPILAAGQLNVLGGKNITIIWEDQVSGHYRPDFVIGYHPFRQRLLEFGFTREQIISFDIFPPDASRRLVAFKAEGTA